MDNELLVQGVVKKIELRVVESIFHALGKKKPVSRIVNASLSVKPEV